MDLRTTMLDRLRERRHTALLVAIVMLFATRPLIGDSGAAPFVFSVAILIVLLIAVLTIQVDDLLGERDVLLVQKRRRSFVGWVLAVPAIGERVLLLFEPGPRLLLLGSISWLVFFSFVTWSQLRSLLKQKEVTGDIISMSVSVYLLFGLTWSLLYIVIFQCQSDAFNLGTSVQNPQHVFPLFIYFSLTTISTIGFGDITPLSLQARYAAVAEGIIGQFYLAILVARLVGMHMTQSADRELRKAQRS